MGKITVVGSLNMDIVTHTKVVPQIGETLMGDNLLYFCGGKGANQAYACANMGAKVTMIGCVGSDDFGRKLVSNLKNNGVDTSLIGVDEEVVSGTAIVTVCNGDNSIIVVSGANSKVSKHFLNCNNRLNSLLKADIILLQLEIPLETIEYIGKFAKENGKKIMLNPAPACKLSEELLSSITYFILNETECEFYTGIKVVTKDDFQIAISKLKSFGIDYPIITLGEKGVIFEENKELIHIEAKKVKVVDTTAAGDTFAGSLATKLTEGATLKEACEFANMVSSVVVQRHGAQKSIPKLSELV